MSDYYERPEAQRTPRNDRKKARRRKVIILRCVLGLVAAIIIALVAFAVVKLVGNNNEDKPSDTSVTSEILQPTSSEEDSEILSKAKSLAASYDYDGAIELLKSVSGYESDDAITSLISEFEKTKESLVAVDVTQVPHVFFHTLIVDFERCFKPSHNESLANGYNAWMITIDEFNKVISQLYENDFVIINISDIYTKDSSGNYSPNKNIMLPEGKKAIVFSYDDTAYYCQYMDWGMADRMVFDENGDIRCEYTDESGNTTMGNYDHVPILIDFCKEHPDFTYHGHKGTLALTGYNGVFGYRTEFRMWDYPSSDESAWLKANPWCKKDNLETYKEEAKKMAEALKENGFEFASHTWGHRHCDQKELSWLKTDTEWWKERVESIVGPTDIFVYPHGSDIASLGDYTSDNEKYMYLKSQGFGVFCGVDGSSYTWNQFRSNYVRQSRIDIDGYLMYQTIIGKSSTLKKLGLDVESIFDSRRKTPVTTS